MPDRIRASHPRGDYERDENGDVVLADFHRRLPYWRCVDCGKWLYGKERHTLEACRRNASGALARFDFGEAT